MFRYAVCFVFILFGFGCDAFVWTPSALASNAAESAEGADLTHGFAGKAQSDPLEFRSDMALFTLIVFVLLLIVLYLAAWKPIQQGLALREATIAEQVESAKKASEDAAAKLAEMQAKFEASAAEAHQLVAQARRDAEAAGSRIIAEAKEDANRQKDRAIAEIQAAKMAALSELGGRSTDLAFHLARGVLGRELKKDDHQGLIQEAVKNFPSQN